ncbi:type II secretion system GspH family protein [Patescibacteria group bacterium]|nr:type II secretion system GspH family protein [Patescibacteria group bacterium]
MSAHLNKPKGFTTFSLHERGFTLIEMLVVIAVMGILAVMGIAIYSGIQQRARDSKRKADIDAIAKAYEGKYLTQYQEITDGDFTSGSIPKDPRDNAYFRFVSATGYKVCASLDASSNPICNTPSTNCYCKLSQQGDLGANDAALPASGYGASIIGVGSSSSCDNLMTSSTYNSTSTDGWQIPDDVQTTTQMAAGPDSDFGGSNVLKFISLSSVVSGNRAWAYHGNAPVPSAQTAQFQQGYTYKITFTYSANNSFQIGNRDNNIATVNSTPPGITAGYSYNYTDSITNGCSWGALCYFSIRLPTYNTTVKIQNLSISTSCL